MQHVCRWQEQLPQRRAVEGRESGKVPAREGSPRIDSTRRARRSRTAGARYIAGGGFGVGLGRRLVPTRWDQDFFFAASSNFFTNLAVSFLKSLRQLLQHSRNSRPSATTPTALAGSSFSSETMQPSRG